MSQPVKELQLRPLGPNEPLLSVRDLSVVYRTPRGDVKAVQDVSFDIMQGEVLGLAGESGCGKTTIANAVLRLLKYPAEIAAGSIYFHGLDITTLTEDELRDFRWKHMSIVFQSAMNALNPVLTVSNQISDAILAHTDMSKKQARERAMELLQLVGIDPARVSSYPHQLSGGMRQRVVIAIAMALNPQLIVLDEPTTALDVVVQKQIMDEIHRLQQQFNFSILFISHDLSLMVEFSDRVGIMYAGQLIELAPSQQIFRKPKHPYTQRLMDSFPSVSGPRTQLRGIPGSPPDLITPPGGCRFHPRCDVAIDGLCQQIVPPFQEYDPNHMAACHLVESQEEADHA
jgi:peptide/nickel transport system ATP-binding protein